MIGSLLLVSRASRVLAIGLAVLLYLGTCVVLVPVALIVCHPMTQHPLRADSAGMPFPIVVLRAGVPRIEVLPESLNPPRLAPDESYLVPAGSEGVVQAALSAADGNNWILRVSGGPGGTQRIDLFIMDDGYRGGTYEASASGVRPIHRRLTGPAYAVIVVGAAVGLASLLWVVVLLGAWWWIRSRTLAVRVKAGPA